MNRMQVILDFLAVVCAVGVMALAVGWYPLAHLEVWQKAAVALGGIACAGGLATPFYRWSKKGCVVGGIVLTLALVVGILAAIWGWPLGYMGVWAKAGLTVVAIAVLALGTKYWAGYLGRCSLGHGGEIFAICMGCFLVVACWVWAK